MMTQYLCGVGVPEARSASLRWSRAHGDRRMILLVLQRSTSFTPTVVPPHLCCRDERHRILATTPAQSLHPPPHLPIPSARPANSKFHQVIHERLQRHIIRKYRLRGLLHAPIPRTGRMSRTRIQFREQKPRLRSTSITHDEAREREAVLDEFLHDTLVCVRRRGG